MNRGVSRNRLKGGAQPCFWPNAPPPLNTPLQMKYYCIRKYFKPIHPFFNRIIEKHIFLYKTCYEMKKRGKMHMCPSLNESSQSSLGEILHGSTGCPMEVAKTNVLVLIVSVVKPCCYNFLHGCRSFSPSLLLTHDRMRTPIRIWG